MPRQPISVRLDDDVAAAVLALRDRGGMTTSEAVNELVRRGIGQAPRRFTQRSSDMGVPMVPLDDVAAVLDRLDRSDEPPPADSHRVSDDPDPLR